MNPQPLNEIFIFFVEQTVPTEENEANYLFHADYDDTARFPTYVHTKSLLFRLLGNLIMLIALPSTLSEFFCPHILLYKSSGVNIFYGAAVIWNLKMECG